MQAFLKIKIIFLILWLGGSVTAFASTQDATLYAVNVDSQPALGQATIHFSTRQQPHFHYFLLDNPRRLVVDFDNTQLNMNLKKMALDQTPFNKVRSGHPKPHVLRLVFDLRESVSIQSYQKKNHDMVLKLKTAKHPVAKVKLPVETLRDIVVLIDPGHGGKDPGATGPHGTKEKDVVLGISKQLYHLLEHEQGMKPAMTRNADYYVTLRERLKKAHSNKSDVFVAIHADAFKHAHAVGASVYALSLKGASSEAARWLAEKENYSELGGVNLDGKNDLLRSVLIDLSQTATISSSLSLGDEVLHQIGRMGKLHHQGVEQAPFMVLKSPDIPSVLVETGFLSNPQEEKKLNDPIYQRRIAEAILQGLRDYFYQKPVSGTWLASHVKALGEYKVARGDSLSSIAHYHHISTSVLKKENHLRNNSIRIGQVLKIPKKG